MSFLQITSDDPELGRRLCKNPASGMFTWRLRLGTLLGWFTGAGTDAVDPTTYNLLFIEGFDELSFGKPGQTSSSAAFADSTQFTSPMAIAAMVAAALDTRLAKPDEEGADGHRFTLTVPALHVRRRNLHNRVWSNLPGAMVEPWPDEPAEAEDAEGTPSLRLAKLTVSAPTVHEVLCTVYVGTFLEAALEHLAGKVTPPEAAKVVRAMNEVGVGYFPRYLLKTCLGQEALGAVADDLQAVPGEHTLRLTTLSNQRTRVDDVLRRMPEDMPVVDLGCGEGAYLGLAKRTGRRLLAVDRLENCRARVAAKAAAKGLDTVSVHADLEEALAELDGAPFACLAAESLEHNEPAEAERLVRILADAGCRLLVATCPNRAFNRWYGLAEGEVRIPDHKFEPTRAELEALLRTGFAQVEVEPLGDLMDDEPTSLLAIARP